MSEHVFQKNDRVTVRNIPDAPFPSVVGCPGIVVSIVDPPPAMVDMFHPQPEGPVVYFVRIGDQIFHMYESDIEAAQS